MKSCKYKAGVTLIEMLIVVAIIALLTSILIAAAARIYNQSKEQLTKNTFALLDAALQEYHEFKGDFPPQSEESFANAAAHSEVLYDALYSIPGSRKILEKISDSLIKHKVDTGIKPPIPEIYDPWNEKAIDYKYNPDIDTFPKLTSAGPDRQFGTPDDITNR